MFSKHPYQVHVCKNVFKNEILNAQQQASLGGGGGGGDDDSDVHQRCLAAKEELEDEIEDLQLKLRRQQNSVRALEEENDEMKTNGERFDEEIAEQKRRFDELQQQQRQQQ